MTESAKVNAALEIVRAVADAIKELGSVPSGHLYARLMGHLSLDNYNAVIGMLKKTGLVREEASHLLVWIDSEQVTVSNDDYWRKGNGCCRT